MKRTYVVVRKQFAKPEVKEQQTTFSKAHFKGSSEAVDNMKWFTSYKEKDFKYEI